ncbi:hypothetical protein CYQ11_22305 [Streptomyces cinnamoneus]|nr:hypothetical protein CYQ11_22305 [Streptomyces cinnamoneus]
MQPAAAAVGEPAAEAVPSVPGTASVSPAPASRSAATFVPNRRIATPSSTAGAWTGPAAGIMPDRFGAWGAYGGIQADSG